jgi:hypothetical protein
MTYRFDSVTHTGKSMQTVQNILNQFKVRGYGGNIDPETPIQLEGWEVGYSIPLQGFYTRGELLAICEDLKAFNDAEEK